MKASMTQRKLAHLLEKPINIKFKFISTNKYSKNYVCMFSIMYVCICGYPSTNDAKKIFNTQI
jgi:hypothetical protein